MLKIKAKANNEWEVRGKLNITMQCNVILGRLKKWPEPVRFIRNQNTVEPNVVIWWPAGFTCFIMALVVDLASSQIFFPTKVVTSLVTTSRDITGTARPSRLDLFRVEIKGMRVDCLWKNVSVPHTGPRMWNYIIINFQSPPPSLNSYLAAFLPWSLISPLPWRWQFWVWQLGGTRRIFLSKSQPGAGGE